ncbi:MAG: hypothetical protein MJ094_01035 [Saccharofermentans sp.]|nr:hypothetical protein [Saccharofermentans sp.]
MNFLRNVILILGASFLGMGTLVTTIFATTGGAGAFLLIPIFFAVIGIVFLVAGIKMLIADKKIKAKGTKYKAKIYSYVDNTSVVVNGTFTVNCKVHFWDKNGIEKEAIIPTGFTRGSNEYPIGMTIDIYEYEGRYDFDKHSVRSEILDREDELMDDKPVDRAQVRMTAISCQSCGITYEAVAGYSASCPYCGHKINAPEV